MSRSLLIAVTCLICATPAPAADKDLPKVSDRGLGTLVKEPTNANDLYERAVHRPESEKELALADLNKAIELNPKMDGAISTRAQLLSSMGKHTEAIADYSLYLKRHPGDYPSLFNRAGEYRAVKRYEESIADYDDILDEDVDLSRTGTAKNHALARTRHYRGNILLEWTKDYAAAAEDYSKALGLDPQITEVRMQLAELHRKLGQFDKSEADYREQFKINPDETGLLGVWAWQLATCPDERFRNGEKAIELAQKDCEKTNWKIPADLSTLAAAYAEAGRFDDAVKMQTRAIEENKLDYWRPIFAKRLQSFEQSQPLRDDPTVKKAS
jgi:tetratricopeptide (TPR) repeat protein